MKTQHPKEYAIWVKMRQRCKNPNDPKFKDYGARGIKVCSEWDSFAQFFEDMGEKPDGLSIDRKDNDKGYSKENCKWSTPLEQANNRRPHKNKTGFPGVRKERNSDRYAAVIWIDGRNKHLGMFGTPEEAHDAWKQAKELAS